MLAEGNIIRLLADGVTEQRFLPRLNLLPLNGLIPRVDTGQVSGVNSFCITSMFAAFRKSMAFSS